MASFNKVILVGNVTRDVELRYTTAQVPVTDIGIAVNRSWYDKATGNKKEEVTFIDVTLWAKTAEVAEKYLKKGRCILIEGRLQLDQWDDNDGNKRSKMRVIGETMTMLGAKDLPDKKPETQSNVPDLNTPIDNIELPF